MIFVPSFICERSREATGRLVADRLAAPAS